MSSTNTDYVRRTIMTDTEQKYIISYNLMATVLYIFLMGIYTVVYFATTYLCFTKRESGQQRRVVLSALTLVYLMCVAYSAILLYCLEQSIVAEGATQTTIALSFLGEGGRKIVRATLVLKNLSVIVSDGLLLWRCFHLWDKSWRVISFPLLLTLSDIVLLIPRIHFRDSGNPITNNNLTSAFFFVSAASTIITTALIGYRVYVATSGITGKRSKTQLRRIFHVLFESAALYTVAVVLEAICLAFQSTSENSPLVTVANYLAPILPIIAGLVPTILVARIITVRSEDGDLTSITHISGLEFQSQQGTRRRDLSPFSRSRGGNGYTIDVEIGIPRVEEENKEKEDLSA